MCAHTFLFPAERPISFSSSSYLLAPVFSDVIVPVPPAVGECAIFGAGFPWSLTPSEELESCSEQ